MSCEDVCEALSARIDGEEPGVPDSRIDAHLAGCPACAAWRDRAEQVTRVARLQPVRVPDLTATVLAAVAADPRVAARRDPRTVLRLAVAGFALAQLAVAAPVLLGGDVHASRETACFELALAVGFALAAWRPDRARAFVPVAAVLAVGLASTSILDVAAAHTLPMNEAGHLAAVMQAGLLWALGREARGTGTELRVRAATPA